MRVAAKNQHAKLEPFPAWVVDIGQWGGRELAPEDSDPSKSSPTVSEVFLQDWMATSETDPFTMNLPDSLHRLVQSRLVQDNAHLARSHVQVRISDRSAISTPVPPLESVNMSITSKQPWSVGPEPVWLLSPMISRPLVGWKLLSRANLQHGSDETSNYPYRMDT